MWSNQVARTIHATRAEVFRVWTDYSARSSWDDHHQWAELHGPLAVGSMIRARTRGGGERTVLITELEADSRVVTEGSVPQATLRFVFDVQDAEAGTVIAPYRQEIDGPAGEQVADAVGPGLAADA